MLWSDVYSLVAEKLPDDTKTDSERPCIYVNSVQQLLYFVDRTEANNKIYSISTAANGLGNRSESLKTPTGLHRIRQKIGCGEPSGTVFIGRESCGRIADHLDNQDQDEITSRILWLDGVEDGINKGDDCDTYSRYIYIHGTSDENRIGQPVSHGCIRMKNADVISLYDVVSIDDFVLIE